MMGLFKDNWLTRKWATMDAARKLDEHHERKCRDMSRAMHKKSPALMQSVLANVMQPDVFLDKHFDTFLRAAISRDDVDLFRAVLDLKKGAHVDYAFTGHWGVGQDQSGFTRTPAFVVALLNGRENIAAYLAEHPDIDVSAGEYKFASYKSGGKTRTQEYFCTKPSELAERNGLYQIAALIEMREMSEQKPTPAASVNHKAPA